MGTRERNQSSTPRSGTPFGGPQFTESPASFRNRNYGASLPRAESTARLASPVPSHAFANTPQRSSSQNRSDAQTPSDVLPLAGGQSATGPGVSALAAALSNSVGTSPPRFGTPPIRAQSPAVAPSHLQQTSATPTNYGSFEARSRYIQNGGTGAYEDPEIVRRHLVLPSDAADSNEPSDLAAVVKGKQPVQTPDTELEEDEFSSLKLQGGDITRPIYNWTEEAEGGGDGEC
jgi:solute carrier family 36 (proton-coupled amino acid transporter)